MTEPSNDWPLSKIVEVPVKSLRAFKNNPRTHNRYQIRQIADSFQAFGWTNPILITAENMIIAGHGRVEAAKLLDLKVVPAIVVNGWSESQVRAYVIADNKLALNAGWNEELLAAELSYLQEAGFAVDIVGFSESELYDLIPADEKYHTDPDDVPVIPKEAITKPGDIWLLGPHRLICGDATNPDTYTVLLEQERADACWTDPPYNVNYQSKAGKIENDNLADGEFLQFLSAALACIFASIKPGASIYVAHADTEGLNFRAAFNAAGFKLSGILIWEKNSLVLGRSDYQWKHEPILYGWKPGAAHSWHGDRKQTTITELNGSVFSQNDDGSITVRVGNDTIVIEGNNLLARPIEPSIIRVDKPKLSAEHPTMKPVELISAMLKNSSKPRDIILDPFGGSGSTLIAAEMLGRKARLIELSPHYCDVIVRRWEDLTSSKASRS